MAYQVLARKWRPKRFADLVGQEHVVGALVNAIKQSRLHHAYLLTGTRGVGKTTIARLLAKSLNCEHAADAEPCGKCANCTQIDTGRFVDLLEIDAASNTGIDNIREVLENAQYAPTVGKYKVYIIDEVHMLSKSAFNAMLKTLEEPPEHVKFILATTDPHKVPITVLSRCLQFVLRNLSVEQIHHHLADIVRQENISAEEEGLMLLARAGAGSMRDALSLLDQAIALGSGSVAAQSVRQMLGVVEREILFKLFKSLVQENSVAIAEVIDEMALKSLGFDTVLNEMALLLRDIARLQCDVSAFDCSHADYPALQSLAKIMPSELAQLYYQCAIYGKKDLPFAPDEYSGFLMTVLRMQAFAPLAGGEIPNNVAIEHSELSDPKPIQPVAAEIVTTPKPSEDGLSEEWTEKPFRQPESTLDAPVNAEQNNPEDAVQLEQNNNIKEQVLQSLPEEETQPDNKTSLLPLNAANWPDIVDALSAQMGGLTVQVLHTALVAVEDGQVSLSIQDKAKRGWDDIQQQKLGDILHQHYQTARLITILPWQDEWQSVVEVRQEQAKQRQKLAMHYLAEDAQAQKIQQTFGGQWLPESVQLID